MPTYLLVLVYFAPAAWGVYHALLYKRDPRAAMGWIMACIFIPYGGPIAYFLFGINRVRTRAQGLQRRFLHVGYEVGLRKIQSAHKGEVGIRYAGWRVSGNAITDGNDVRPLYNGEAAYPEMLAAIDQASERVMLATYIFKVDATGLAFADALQRAVARGVDVRVLIDGVGELYSWRRPSRMLRKRGVPVARFLPPRLLPPSIYVNLRHHRKMLLVDNQVGFAGGMNISDQHTSATNQEREISDVHFALRGPVVSDLVDLFCFDWHFASGTPVEVTNAAPPHQPADMGCRVLPDGPDDELDALASTIQTVISAAEKSVDIMTPYFLPGRELMASIESAALRGVKVRLVLPQKNNLFYVDWAQRNLLAEILRWDIEAYYQPAPFCHAKLLCIDGNYSMIGSANLDTRSLRLNFELGIEVFSEAFNREIDSYFERVVAVSARARYADLANRSVGIRLRDSAAALFTPYL
ncbi:MAG: phospholipase D-like domain-containing protein [Woeseiaceae bacterium]|nr:phospholipase D-like domain-containing protein [Woeseiaceae bacterium]